MLLDPDNLLTREGLRRSLSKPMDGNFHGSLRDASRLGSKPSWTVGCSYRTLAQVVLREGSDPGSKRLRKLPIHTLVSVDEVQNISQPQRIGEAMYAVDKLAAKITVQEGPLLRQVGWIDCRGKDGLDLLDTRDHAEVDRVLEQHKSGALDIKEVVAPSWTVAQANDASETEEPRERQAAFEQRMDELLHPVDAAAAAQRAADAAMRQSESQLEAATDPQATSRSSKSRGSRGLDVLAEKLQQLEAENGREDRLVDDPTILQEPPSMCGRMCTCGVSGAPRSGRTS